MKVVETGIATDEGKATVIVDPVVRAPVPDGVKPTVQSVGLDSIVDWALKLTALTDVEVVSVGVEVGLTAEAESDDVSSEY